VDSAVNNFSPGVFSENPAKNPCVTKFLRYIKNFSGGLLNDDV
jgi:hypothetical protein